MKTLSSHPSIRYCGNKKAEYAYAEQKYGDAAKDQPDGYGEDKSPYAKDKAAYAEGSYGADKSAPAPYPPGYLAYEDDDCKADNRQFYEVSRQNRWKYLGLVNEPGLRQWDVKGCDWKNDKKTDQEPFGKCGDPERFGLWLDERVRLPARSVRERAEVSRA